MTDADQLREEIANDLVALRRVVGRRAPTPDAPRVDLGEPPQRLLRGNPAWVAAVVAGALAGLWVASRGRGRRVE